MWGSTREFMVWFTEELRPVYTQSRVITCIRCYQIEVSMLSMECALLWTYRDRQVRLAVTCCSTVVREGIDEGCSWDQGGLNGGCPCQCILYRSEGCTLETCPVSGRHWGGSSFSSSRSQVPHCNTRPLPEVHGPPATWERRSSCRHFLLVWNSCSLLL